jgi:hypothetical protein
MSQLVLACLRTLLGMCSAMLGQHCQGMMLCSQCAKLQVSGGGGVAPQLLLDLCKLAPPADSEAALASLTGRCAVQLGLMH